MASGTVWRVPESIPLPENFVGFDPRSSLADESFSSYERNLPHWRVEGACYFTTFRLRDSLPKVVVDKMRLEAELWHVRLAKVAALHAGRLPPEEAAAWQEHQRTQMLKLDLLLDEGQGECILRAPDQRFIVAEALLHFEGKRNQMQAFAIMPNHVHVLCRPLAGYTLEDLCGSWKWFTSQRIQEGIVAGGGVALIRAGENLHTIKTHNEDEKTGVDIIRRAIEAPLRTIISNSGLEASVIVNKVKEGKADFGYNAREDRYENLIAVGVIDPAKVTRLALENAASVSALLLTTDCVISDDKEDAPSAPAMPGGGMGGMY